MEILKPDSGKLQRSIPHILLPLAVVAIIASAFHFWPFESNSLWKLANPANTAIIISTGLIALSYICSKDRPALDEVLPPLSIWAYLLFNLLSCAYADTLSRPAIYTAKVSLVMIGGYILFAQTMQSPKRKYVVWSVIAACVICVSSALYTQFITKAPRCGFFESNYKYGTYIGIIASFTVVYLVCQISRRNYVIALSILVGLALTFKNIGGPIGFVSGLFTALMVSNQKSQRIALCAAILLFIVTTVFFNPKLIKDFKLIENDSDNLRQRYIEWQSELNMLEKFGVTGSGAGSINDYRSNYYYRLPKLNTLQPFDQNGYLTVTAEIGIIGLLCFVWILLEHGSYLFKSRSHLSPELLRINTSLSAAFVAACACNLFSSVHYNGVLIAFVLVLALSRSLYNLAGKDCL